MEPLRSGGRLGRSVVTLFAVSLLVFALFELRPAAHLTRVLGANVTASEAERFEDRVGLNRSAPVRFSSWLGSMLTGDFGRSFSGGVARDQTVAAVIGPRFTNSVLLAALGFALMLPCALGAGLLTAAYPPERAGGALGSAGGALVRATIWATAAAPLFLVPLLAIGWGPFADGAGRFSWPSSLMFAGGVLALTVFGPALQAVRSVFLLAVREPHVEMAHLRGVPPWRLATRHVLPAARAGLGAAAARGAALFVTALIVVETACRFPGIGALMVDAALAADVPVVQVCALLLALGVIAAGAAAGSAVYAGDPRAGRPR